MSRTQRGEKGPGWEFIDPRGGWVGVGSAWRRILRHRTRSRDKAQLRRDLDL